MCLAVAISGTGFNAQEVVAGQLRLDALEYASACPDHIEQRTSGCARQQLEAFRSRIPVVHRRQRRASIFGHGREELIVQLQRVDARAGGGRNRAEFDDGAPLIVENETLGHQKHRLRAFDGLERVQQRPQHVDGLKAVVRAGQRFLLRLLLYFDLTRIKGRPGHPCALANDNLLENARIAS